MTRRLLQTILRWSATLLVAFLVASCNVPPSTFVAGGGNNSCEYAFDGDCDEPGRGTGLCAAKTDASDCAIRNPGPNSCQFAHDGQCGHPGVGTGVCPPSTDVADCQSVASRGGANSCAYAFDGDCDEPGRGTGLCAAGTDVRDCANRNPGPNSCQYAFDDECDHPGVGTGACPPRTDIADCQSAGAAGGGENSCQFAFDGECDHPDIGTGACPPKTDMADCGGAVAELPARGNSSRPPAIPSNARPRSSGTGFYINDGGDLVTNFHVIEGCRAVGVKTDTEIVPASTMVADERLDIAVLRTGLNPGRASFLRSTSEPSLGQRVFVVGYPLLGELRSVNFTEGLVSSLTGFRGDEQALQTSAAVQPGNSGGPLLDEGGVVIGVVNARIEQADNVGFAVRVDALIELLRREGIEFRGAGALTPVRTETIASRAAEYTFPILCYGGR